MDSEKDIVTHPRATYRQMIIEQPKGLLTIDQICKRAHVSRSTFYTYFDNRFELLSSIFYEDAIAPIMALPPQYLKLRGTEEQVPVILEMMLQGIKDDQEFYQIITRRGGISSLRRAIYEHSMKLYRYLESPDAKEPTAARNHLSATKGTEGPDSGHSKGISSGNARFDTDHARRRGARSGGSLRRPDQRHLGVGPRRSQGIPRRARP